MIRLFCLKHQEVALAVKRPDNVRAASIDFIGYETQPGDMLVAPCPKCLGEKKE